ncbi:hypothetical protein A2526_03090 [candidate division WOR-1 bacterium RIFOXYD2_FULL_36_8]|uniref:Polymerase beta nucleotidyltransferase domain-containing protein n=1 Tax=candidate division WOR-1 bacterium RIFOXYB2_FULL_36_35 TaxID=1802578 RepID=A0A1F4S3D8_UNCSA|nr:MAG: hypothetical protein A2230_06510 [candidate division WOR-1 bacterium RIFOXYA2_FULL_36_21]OGC14909.1 MAG: hypothetical protein A2290_07410 [candidate division WOR-1 bacterium RIFOXYB2_FULL_36_35]OGC16738.1 MAG: hypothetical protein A2282_03965 [candidate division WOR-1 bacterium RIFOXYA12_FULL_36_13]OGC41095.1 MAG: hypothetical protein A2526_03090 [candidate division WOR-1 bacterium RIFOXYD2_FULL_36_8]
MKKKLNKKDIFKLIRTIVDKSINRVKPQKVILFGSYAYGNPNNDSDVDLLFIKNTKQSNLEKHRFVSSRIDHVLPLDILVKTDFEVDKRLKMGDPFYKEIIKKGRVLYEST